MAGTIVDRLKSQWTDKHVKADANRPELARFAGKVGKVVTVNENGHALVDFADGPWYDIALSHLTETEASAAPAAAGHKK